MLKKLLAIKFILFISMGCETFNSLRMMQVNSEIEPIYADELVNRNQNRLQLESTFLGEKPYIYATVDGVKLLFLVDTGARFPMLMDSPKVQQMKLNRGFDIALSGWGDEEESQAYQTDIKRIDFGGVYFENVKAAFIPTSKTQYFLRKDEAVYDGVIGHDIMQHFTWEFDKSQNSIVISSEKYIPESNAQYLELSSFFSKISIDGHLTFNSEVTVNESFIIDTGSRHYLKLSSAYPKIHDIKINSTRVRAADFGLSGKTEHDRVTLPKLRLGDIHVENIKVNLIPSDDEDDWWIIGNAFLNQFKTVIDYKNGAFYLVPQKAFVINYNLMGLELRKVQSGHFVVRFVFPNLPASYTDIQVGDLVTQINGVESSEISLEAYNDISSTIKRQEVCIERANQCFLLETKPIKGFSDF